MCVCVFVEGGGSILTVFLKQVALRGGGGGVWVGGGVSSLTKGPLEKNNSIFSGGGRPKGKHMKHSAPRRGVNNSRAEANTKKGSTAPFSAVRSAGGPSQMEVHRTSHIAEMRGAISGGFCLCRSDPFQDQPLAPCRSDVTAITPSGGSAATSHDRETRGDHLWDLPPQHKREASNPAVALNRPPVPRRPQH